MKLNDPAKILNWLARKPSPSELRDAFPERWDAVESELGKAIAERDPVRLHRLLKPETAVGTKKTLGKKDKQRLVDQLVQQRMATVALEHYSRVIGLGKTTGKIRFNLFNGLLAQRLLFRTGFERKPVSMFWFRLLWPLIWQKRYLMPLVESKGIYCFYSAGLIAEFAKLIGNRTCLEIGAGDGTLSRFLRERGTTITATDDYSWSHRIQYPDWVERADAKSALQRHAPQVVLCSWPPAQNTFEASVFKTQSVELYIAIVSEFRFAAGNWADYERQTAFTIEHQPALSRLVLPPELGSQVVIFRRKSA